MEPGLNDRDDDRQIPGGPPGRQAAMEPGLNDRDDPREAWEFLGISKPPQWSPA